MRRLIGAAAKADMVHKALDLPNLDSHPRAMLAAAGIHSEARLRRSGAVLTKVKCITPKTWRN